MTSFFTFALVFVQALVDQMDRWLSGWQNEWVQLLQITASSHLQLPQPVHTTCQKELC